MLVIIAAVIIALVIFSMLRSLFFPAVMLFGAIFALHYFETHSGVCVTDQCSEARVGK